MPWENDSRRRSELPADWQAIRARIKARAGGRCELTMRDGSRCRDAGTDCHHLRDRFDHSDGNLQWVCAWHHRKITAREAAAGRAPVTEAYPQRKHPGLR